MTACATSQFEPQHSLTLSNFDSSGFDDAFDLNLDDSTSERLFSNSGGSAAFERLFGDDHDEIERMFLDDDVEMDQGGGGNAPTSYGNGGGNFSKSEPTLFGNMDFDPVHQQDEEVPPSYQTNDDVDGNFISVVSVPLNDGGGGRNKKKRAKNNSGPRRRASQPAPYKPDEMGMSFDPSPSPYDPSSNPCNAAQQRRGQANSSRRMSENDLAAFDDSASYASAPVELRFHDNNFQDIVVPTFAPQEARQPAMLPRANSHNRAAPSANSSHHAKDGPRRRSTLDSTHAPSLATLLGHHQSQYGPQVGTQDGCENTFEYHEALQKLAASMRRTELSRRQLEMQRACAPPTPPAHHQQMQQNSHQVQDSYQRQNSHHSLHSAQELLQRRVSNGSSSPTSNNLSSNLSSNMSRSGSSCSLLSLGGPPFNDANMISGAHNMNNSTHGMSSMNNSTHSSNMSSNGGSRDNLAAFFSGSRGTLTNGLEQSRRQLRAYAEATRLLG